MSYRFAVFGDPIAHSKSPDIHRRFAEQLALEVVYDKLLVKEREFETEVRRFFDEGGHGLSITVPHKWAAHQIADHLSIEASSAGACNTLMSTDRGLYGHNTGCLGPLIDRGPDEIVIANRSIEKLDRLVGRYDRRVRGIGLSELDSQGRPFDLVINGISAGLSGSTGVELTDRIVNADGACYDLVYSSDDTPFLKMCRSFTDQRADGLGMLLAQAARQFELWTGLYPDPFEQLIAFGRSPDSRR